MNTFANLKKDELRNKEVIENHIKEILEQYPETPIFTDETGKRIPYTKLTFEQKLKMDSIVKEQYQNSFEVMQCNAELICKEISGKIEALVIEQDQTIIIMDIENKMSYDVLTKKEETIVYPTSLKDWNEFKKECLEENNCYFVTFEN